MDNSNNYSFNYETIYWMYTQFGGGNKWGTLLHNGVLFPPEYIPHKIPIIYNNTEIVLPPLAEEFATIYSKFIDTEYINNKNFKKNFWYDWKKLLKGTPIENLENCDFKKIYEHVITEKIKKKEIPKEIKEEERKLRHEQEKKYSIAVVDGKEQPVGNFKIEPPGIFIGRGCHPKLGKIKRRIYPEDITINISKNVSIPEPLPGHKWRKIIHDKQVEWLVSWKDTITDKTKYVWLGAHSELKGKNDLEKFDRSRRLKKKIKHIREENTKNMQSTDIKTKQIATALYFIDNFALRVGNEKSEDQADTVGVTSLRVEHIKLCDNNIVDLDFLGKDSVRYKNKVNVVDIVYNNLQQFVVNKTKYDLLFDLVTPVDLNKYLQSFMSDLTSKVFRTFNASYLFYKELKKINNKMEKYEGDDKINILLDLFNKANAKVAILCNHQKNISKSFNTQIDKINSELKKIKNKLKNEKLKPTNKHKLKNKYKKLKEKKNMRIELKNISLGTSKTNYIDSRITISFMKKHKIPIDKLFNKSLQQKFSWSMDIDENWKY